MTKRWPAIGFLRMSPKSAAVRVLLKALDAVPVDSYDSTAWQLRNVLLRSEGVRIGPKSTISYGFRCLFTSNGHPPAPIEIGRYVRLGDNAHFYNFGSIRVGDFSTFAQNTVIVNGWHRKENFFPESGPTEIGRGVWVGAGVQIVGSVRIGDFSIIGAGSVVNSDLPACSIAVGVPARLVGSRELDQRQWLAPGIYYDRDTFQTEQELQKSGAFADMGTTWQLRWMNSLTDIGPHDDVRDLLAGKDVANGLFVGDGWYPLEHHEGEAMRWAANDAEIVVTAPALGRRLLSIEIEPGPDTSSGVLPLEVVDDRQVVVGKAAVCGRQWVEVELPLPKAPAARYRLHASRPAAVLPADPRRLTFRAFSIKWGESRTAT